MTNRFSKRLLTFFESEKNRRGFYFIYTLCFLLVAALCFLRFIAEGRSLIWRSDGWEQHYKALVYYSRFLREIIRRLLNEHRLIIPEWDFCIGEGSDIVNTLHFYVMGDPIALLSVFVPFKLMPYFYSCSNILRLYLAGAAFSALSFGTGIKNRYGILAGSLSYCFCAWALHNAATHPFFLNPMIYFPLMILGIEKIIRKEKPFLFIVSAALSSVSNFYYFYMIVLLAVAYALIRLIILYKKDLKQGLAVLIRMGVMAVLGVSIGAILLLPIMMMFLQDSRFSVSQPFHLFYLLPYYLRLPSIAISAQNSYWLYIGFSAPIVIAILFLLLNPAENDRKEHFLRIIFFFCVLIIIFPIAGRILNGMSYMTNRWSWAFAILGAYILGNEWERLMHINAEEWKRLAFGVILYFIICFLLPYSKDAGTLSAIILMLISVICLKFNTSSLPTGQNKRICQICTVALACVSVVNLSYWKFSSQAENYAEQCKVYDTINKEWSDNEAAVIKKNAEESYIRYTGRSISKNVNFISATSNTQYFWSNSNPYLGTFSSELEMRELLYQSYEGYDDRTAPIALSAVQYYSTKNGDTEGLPYGFKLIESESGFSVYKNENVLPLGYCYDMWIPESAWSKYNAVQKQEIQLEACCLDKGTDLVSQTDPKSEEYAVPFTIESDSDVFFQTNEGFVTVADNVQFVIKTDDDQKNAELYVEFSGFDFKPTHTFNLYSDDESIDPSNKYTKEDWRKLPLVKKLVSLRNRVLWSSIQNAELTFKTEDGVTKTVTYRPPDASFSSGRNSFIVNLGFSEENVNEVAVKLPKKGIYSFTGLKVYKIPMEGFDEKIGKLKMDSLQDVLIDTNTIIGQIDLETPKILCVAVPFAKGWKAFVDDKETSVRCVNKRYLGIVVQEGTHKITLRYHAPYRILGVCITFAGLFIFVCMVAFQKKKNNRDNRSDQ